MIQQPTTRSFLESLNLSEYSDVFEQNDVSVTMLSTLTADDLKELGVTSLGHRKAILTGVQALQGVSAAPSGASQENPASSNASAAEAPQPSPEPETLNVREAVDPAFIVEKVDKFKGMRMRISRYSIEAGGSRKVASLSSSDPVAGLTGRLAAHELMVKLTRMPYGTEIFVRCVYNELATGNVMGIHVLYYGDGWMFLRSGGLIFLVDGTPIQLKPVTHNEETVRGSIVGEEVIYPIRMQQFQALCDAESIEVQVSGSKGSVEFATDTRMFRQFYNQLFDATAYTDSVDMRSDSQKKADTARVAREAEKVNGTAGPEASVSTQTTQGTPGDTSIGFAIAGSLISMGVLGAICGWAIVTAMPGEQLIGHYAWPGFILGGLFARSMHKQAMRTANADGVLEFSEEADRNSKIAVIGTLAVLLVMAFI